MNPHGVMIEPVAGVPWDILEHRNVTSDWSLLIFVLLALIVALMTVANDSTAALTTEMSDVNLSVI